MTPLSPEEMDHRLLVALRTRGTDPRVAAVARALSHGGEHGALWLAAGLAGAAADRSRRPAWLRGTALSCGAHLLSVGLKRVVRRPRPLLPGHAPLVRTASPHSFPSAHAASATAAAVALGALWPVGTPLPVLSVPPGLPGLPFLPVLPVLPVVAAAVCLSRLVVGVHYPSDVAAGAVLGALTARVGGGRARGVCERWARGVRGARPWSARGGRP